MDIYQWRRACGFNNWKEAAAATGLAARTFEHYAQGRKIPKHVTVLLRYVKTHRKG